MNSPLRVPSFPLVTRLTLSLVLALCLALPASAATPPRVSPLATVSQVVGVSDVEITYSRPSVRERVIFGDLVPFGEVWRTGANEATTISFEHDVKVAGQDLAAGTYALFTLPGESSWTLIFHSQTDLWGAFGRDEAKDVLKVEVKPQAAPFAEMMTFTFPSVTSDADGSRATVQLHWAEVAVPFEIAFGQDVLLKTARADVEAAMAAEEPDLGVVRNWASYFYGNDLATDEAEAWAAKLAEHQADAYGAQALYARLLAKNGKTAEAVAQAQTALALVPDDASGRLAQDAASLREELAGWQE